MDLPLVFTEMAVVIAVEKQDVKLISHEFLVQCGVVPSDWELAAEPIVGETGTLIRYTNNCAIASNPKQIQLVQPFSGQPNEVQVSQMALRYCDILRTLTYRAIGINFKAFADLQHQKEPPNEYILKFLHPEKINTRPTKASLNLSYAFNRNTLNLSIVDAALSMPEGASQSGVIFTGNCETRFDENDQSQIQDKVQATLNAWEIDFARYTTIVTDFLK